MKILGSETCSVLMSERKLSQKEDQLIISWTLAPLPGKMASVLGRKVGVQQVGSEHKAVPLQRSAPVTFHIPRGPSTPMV